MTRLARHPDSVLGRRRGALLGATGSDSLRPTSRPDERILVRVERGTVIDLGEMSRERPAELDRLVGNGLGYGRRQHPARRQAGCGELVTKSSASAANGPSMLKR
jgi:hypothetical protein